MPPHTIPFQTGLIFIFNLIVGTGALTLPSVFSRAGWLLGSVVIALLAFLSYVTLTFVVEAISCANAISNYRRSVRKEIQPRPATYQSQENRPRDEHNNSEAPINTQTPRRYSSDIVEEEEEDDHVAVDSENTPLTGYQPIGFYSLDEKFELGVMANLFFTKIGVVCFYLCICVYLYGDLSIYNAAVAKTLTDLICGGNASAPVNATIDYFSSVPGEDEDCWKGFSRFSLYKINMVAFVSVIGPFAFFNVQKTKYIQISTALFRWLAFAIMIVLACARFFNGTADGHPPAADFSQITNMFGVCIYSFMCHHSIPSLVSPIKRKERLNLGLGIDYTGIGAFYLLLAITGSFAFRNLSDLYTLNFVPRDSDSTGFNALKLIEYFLAVFPVFTLAASYPIIAITLRNNLSILFVDMSRFEFYGFFVRRIVFPLMAIVPPLIITLNTENINSLVRFTGSYAGAGIQYLIPVALIYLARRKTQFILGSSNSLNPYQSPFRHPAWLVAVMVWTGISVTLVSFTFLWT